MPLRGHEAPLGPPRAAGPDVAVQRAHDRQPPVEWTLWQARTRAVDEAREAVEAGEADDAPLRAALVDVASVCVELASRLRTPTLAQRDTVAPIGCACGCCA